MRKRRKLGLGYAATKEVLPEILLAMDLFKSYPQPVQ